MLFPVGASAVIHKVVTVTSSGSVFGSVSSESACVPSSGSSESLVKVLPSGVVYVTVAELIILSSKVSASVITCSAVTIWVSPGAKSGIISVPPVTFAFASAILILVKVVFPVLLIVITYEIISPTFISPLASVSL